MYSLCYVLQCCKFRLFFIQKQENHKNISFNFSQQNCINSVSKNLSWTFWLQSYNQQNYFARKSPVPLLFTSYCKSISNKRQKCALWLFCTNPPKLKRNFIKNEPKILVQIRPEAQRAEPGWLPHIRKSRPAIIRYSYHSSSSMSSRLRWVFSMARGEPTCASIISWCSSFTFDAAFPRR